LPAHHYLEEDLDVYIEAAGLADDKKGPRFRTALGKTKQLTAKPMRASDAWAMIRRRAEDAGLETAVC
jgi:hypothetical protein